MSTDKTLADVQPGGRVRLGDSQHVLVNAAHLERVLVCAEGNHFDDCTADKNTTMTQAIEQMRAALSAQPSPGGQGDAPPCWWIDHGTYGQITQRQDEADAAVNAGKRVVSYVASQPVGEPVGQVRETVGRGFIAELLPGVSDRVSNMAPLYLQPPAQAVNHQAALLAEERAHGETIDQRDRYHEVADELAARIAAITGVDIGEHSSANCPWRNAIEAVEEYKPAQAVDLGTGVKAIAAERERQLQAEGFTRDGDQQYRHGELARAATAYVQLAAMDLAAGGTRDHIAWHGPAAVWPWAPEWWKPVDARRDLVRAGALIAAQIDLIDSQAVGK
jgi:hypothetical protein